MAPKKATSTSSKPKPKEGTTAKKKSAASTGTKTKTTSAAKPKSQSAAPKGRSAGTSSQVQMKIKPEKSLIQYEIELIGLFAFTVLSVIALYTNAIGTIGQVLRGFYLSMLGFTGYVIPYFAFLWIFLSINKHFKGKRLRLNSALLCLFISVMLFSSVAHIDVITSSLQTASVDLYTYEGLKISMADGIQGTGGGVIGNALATLFILGLGKFGTYLIATVLLALSIVLGFKVSITGFVKNKSVQTARQVKPVAVKLAQRADQSLRGVSADTLDYHERENQRPIEAYDSDAFLEDQNPAKITGTAMSHDEWQASIDGRDRSVYDPYIDPITGEYKDDLNDPEAFKPLDYVSPYAQEGSSLLTDPLLGEVSALEMNEASQQLVETIAALKEDEFDGELPELETEDEIFSQYTPGIAINGIDESAQLGWTVDDEALEALDPEDMLAEDVLLDEDALTLEETTDLMGDSELDLMGTEADVTSTAKPVAEAVTIATEAKEPAAEKPAPPPKKPYILPPLSLLQQAKAKSNTGRDEIYENCKILETTMRNFGVDAKVVEVTKGPTITMYEVLPSPGVKVSKIVNLSDDIALALAAHQVRIIAPIPGKSAVGIEIPNKDTTMVTAREVLESEEFQKTDSKITFALGKDITGKAVTADMAKMPHLLIAGSTGSGKSVCVNTIINSILFYANPDEVKLLMIDPKVVELSHYNGIPHLILPVVVDPKKAAAALNWAVNEMTSRYKAFADNMVKDINSYNRKAETMPELGLTKLPKIVILIDELADLMMVAPNQVEDAICRLAQMARAAGLHLIVATQRPSVDVITGLIKANIPSRIAFAVSSQIDSRTILDMAGAEKLLGKGDMLFYPLGSNKPQRVQGAFLSDAEVEAVVGFIKNQSLEVVYQEDIISDLPETDLSQEADELLNDAINLIVETQQASISMLQRRFRVGYNRAARLVDQMEERGIVGPSLGSKPREVLMNKHQWEELKN